jgi:nucleoside phosphorylase
VCQGAEYQAVCNGLRRATGSVPQVVPIPVGPQAVHRCLQTWLQGNPLSQLVLVMGLCGSLNPGLGVGQAVLYQTCVYGTAETELLQTVGRKLECDRPLTDWLQAELPQVARVDALTSDRLIHRATEKQYLAQASGTDVVDMEGFAVLESLQQAGIQVAMLRVVSDACTHDLPNLNTALSAEGKLQPLPMALSMMRQPQAAARLIQGSLKGLQQLQQISANLFS